MNFKGKCVVVGVCGGIAAYKTASLVSRLRQYSADVHCIMTEHATHFIGPMTFGELSGNDVTIDMFANVTKWDVQHISLAKAADVIVVAPATANILGKVANGIADDMLTTTIMATKKPVFFVPSMNTQMYENPIVQSNIETLRNLGYHFIEPETGHLACNTVGKGRFPKERIIMNALEKVLCGSGLLTGKKVLISAGGTKENIDPVRYIGNRSSGRMGYAIAKAAVMEGAHVTLVSCTDALEDPADIEIIHVRDARQLEQAMNERYENSDIAIMAAAVSDYRPRTQAQKKIKKEMNTALQIDLELNPDILYGLGKKKSHQFLVGFAAETNDVITHGKEKLRAKNLDMLVANDVTLPGAGFNVTTNIISILYKDGSIENYPELEKDELGHILIQTISKCMG